MMREYSGRVYDIPPERVCGTAQADEFGNSKDGKPILPQEPTRTLDRRSAQRKSPFHLRLG